MASSRTSVQALAIPDHDIRPIVHTGAQVVAHSTVDGSRNWPRLTGHRLVHQINKLN